MEVSGGPDSMIDMMNWENALRMNSLVPVLYYFFDCLYLNSSFP